MELFYGFYLKQVQYCFKQIPILYSVFKKRCKPYSAKHYYLWSRAWTGEKTSRLHHCRKDAQGCTWRNLPRVSFLMFILVWRTWLPDKAASHTPLTLLCRDTDPWDEQRSVHPCGCSLSQATLGQAVTGATTKSHPKATTFSTGVTPTPDNGNWQQNQEFSEEMWTTWTGHSPSSQSWLFHQPNPRQRDSTRNSLIPKASRTEEHGTQEDNTTDSRFSFPSPARSFFPTTVVPALNQSEPSHLFQHEGLKMIIPNKCKGFRTEPEPSLLLNCWRLPWLLWCNNTWKLLFFETNLNTLNCWKIKNRSQLITLTLISYSANESLFITT